MNSKCNLVSLTNFVLIRLLHVGIKYLYLKENIKSIVNC